MSTRDFIKLVFKNQTGRWTEVAFIAIALNNREEGQLITN